jgi:hypothetical protein
MTGTKAFLPTLLLLFSLIHWQCSLGPGSGGKSTIAGKVLVREINSGGIMVKEYYAPDERVYLIYGEDSVYNEEFDTSYEGSYEFTFLRKGDYQVFAYSDCPTCFGETEAVFETVTISENGEVVQVPDLIILKYL